MFIATIYVKPWSICNLAGKAPNQVSWILKMLEKYDGTDNLFPTPLVSKTLLSNSYYDKYLEIDRRDKERW